MCRLFVLICLASSIITAVNDVPDAPLLRPIDPPACDMSPLMLPPSVVDLEFELNLNTHYDVPIMEEVLVQDSQMICPDYRTIIITLMVVYSVTWLISG